MVTKHNFVGLAQVQKEQHTLYCAGLDVHPFGSLDDNLAVYGSVISSVDEQIVLKQKEQYYFQILPYSGINNDLSHLLACVECYLIRVIDVLIGKCNVRVFKLQAAFYEQFGPAGWFLLCRVNEYIETLSAEMGISVIRILDCKRGDIDTTQAAYFTGLLGNLKNDWGIDYSPFDFDIINVTPWMGRDVMVLGTKEKPGLGLRLMNEGKGLIVVNKTSNPSGPEYQEREIFGRMQTLQMVNVKDMCDISKNFELDCDGLSSIGLVVGSTHACDGSIRAAFPSTTLLVPGFGAQGGKFNLIMRELINTGKWNGQGAIFSSSRGTMYPWMEKLGGSGNVHNLESDLIKAVDNFRVNEQEAYQAPEVQGLGIIYPFAA